MKTKTIILIAVFLFIVIVFTCSIGDFNNDNQYSEEIITTAQHEKVLIDRPKGYRISFPENMNIDLTLSSEQIKCYDDDMTVIITREWSPYYDTWKYIDMHFNNYLFNERYQETNNIKLTQNSLDKINGRKTQLISLERKVEFQTVERQNCYTYCYIQSKKNQRSFFRIMFKYHNYQNVVSKIQNIICSFDEINVDGNSTFNTDYNSFENPFWNKETKELYQKIKKSKSIDWGIFIDGSYINDNSYKKIKEIENKINYDFKYALHYMNLDNDFPVNEMTKFYNDGKITELTLQISNHANDDLFGKNKNFDLYDGKYEEAIRKFARGAKKFGHPFLFRLNNEMNSDWVNYSGVSTLSDPEIFIENWRRIYNIFDEEGVDNAIWIFNPNAEDCPPAHWNSYISYFPGNEYVHLIGMTGYNTGTYYAEKYNEKWRTFDEIYEEPYERYMTVFGNYPFIITEFASSSFGGDKVKWINDMFSSIKKYDNIKMALWWSSADYDMSKEHYKELARPYFLDETEETIEAFKKGLRKKFFWRIK